MSGLTKSGPTSGTPKSAGPSRQGSAAAYHKSSSSSKRPRSVSRSESPPPHKKRAVSDDLDHDISSTIWQLFGRDRTKYVSRDVLSDDEDMEVDARILEQEEKLSMKVAKREDMAALEDERRHEEEKRRRKKERERMLARGS
ncbi:hypothetical protein BDQ17DRAFT_1350856 [Cyathus striatus]|nr:hypothetical protein BDQ17DRAFT_1350856 [Cyathus striatus]